VVCGGLLEALERREQLACSTNKKIDSQHNHRVEETASTRSPGVVETGLRRARGPRLARLQLGGAALLAGRTPCAFRSRSEGARAQGSYRGTSLIRTPPLLGPYLAHKKQPLPGPCADAQCPTAAERSGKNLTRLQDFDLKAKARLWPGLSYLCHIRSEAARTWRGAGRLSVSSAEAACAKTAPPGWVPSVARCSANMAQDSQGHILALAFL